MRRTKRAYHRHIAEVPAPIENKVEEEKITMMKKATLICPRCKLAADMTIKMDEPLPNKCDRCGSERVMTTHLVVNIPEAGEIEARKRNRDTIDKVAKQGAEVMAAGLVRN